MQTMLSKDGRTVLCGKPRCGREIAWVLERGGGRVVWFTPGWFRRRDGTWTVSARAQRRIKHGHSPEARKWSHQTELHDPLSILGFIPLRLPELAQCRRCGWSQWLDARRLDVDPALRGVSQKLVDDLPAPYLLERLAGDPEIKRWKRYREELRRAAP